MAGTGIKMPFAAVPAGGMFQYKRDDIFKDLPKAFGIMDDIFSVGYVADGSDHDRMLSCDKCNKDNLKLNMMNVISAVGGYLSLVRKY